MTVCASLRDVVDEVVCAETPEPFFAVGVWYDDFGPTSDGEVQEVLRRAADRQPRCSPSARRGGRGTPRPGLGGRRGARGGYPAPWREG